ncbi:hypothetical protein GCM10011369_08370 [Neiella marina]|uniref:HD-GYP domain-containing protein n=1 Tax=Neiella marina TaxID=508461 RepID=A0A8J2U2X8_9GAMM|nr:HD domain-containing phosphohydrolase [Neiella marina]GGA69058.1 hypothetical protein GCM10011369_08370 [Neiella marina]
MDLSFKRLTFRVTLVGLCSLIAIVTSLVAISLQYYFSKQITVNASQQLTHQIAQQIEQSIDKMDQTASSTVSILAQHSDLVSEYQVGRKTDRFLADVLLEFNDLYAIYYGFENGDFYEIINLEANSTIRQQLNAAFEDRFIRIHIFSEQGQRWKKTDFLDEQLRLRHSHIEPSSYDARKRPWFTNASSDAVFKTKPYFFQHLKATGKTYSRVVDGATSIIAVDLTLATITEQLADTLDGIEGYASSEGYIYGENGDLILANKQGAANDAFEVTPLALSPEQVKFRDSLGTVMISNENDWAPIDFAISGEPKGFTPELFKILAEKLRLPIAFVNGYSWSELVELYLDGVIDVLQPIHRTANNIDWGIYSDPLLHMPMAIVTQSGAPVVSSLEQLNGKRLAVPRGWSILRSIEQSYPDIELVVVDSLIASLNAVKSGLADAAIDSELITTYTAKMYFLDGLAFHPGVDVSELDFDTNLRLVSADKRLTDLFNYALTNLDDAEHAYLNNKWLAFDNGSASVEESSTVPYQELITLAKEEQYHGYLRTETIAGKDFLLFVTPTSLGPFERNYLALMLPVADVYAEGLSHVKKSITITLIILALLLPLTWLVASPIVRAMRSLSVENEKIRNRQYDQLAPRSSFIVDIDEVFVSLNDMALSIQDYQRKQAELLDSFVELIAQAIDDKSPYTAGHCNRVPELGLMLAAVASEDNTEHFKSFALDTEDKRREFKLAAWLHDCGKVITPEHIVDKGSKLECIYNRIHEVRMRFEVIWRDLEIDFLKQAAEQPGQRAELLQSLNQQREQLQSDFEFVAACNQGGEFMADDKLAKLEQISNRTWQRHFSDQLGLSPLEELSVGERQSLPVTENLLMDKDSHIVHRAAPIQYPPHLGINVDIPEYKANLGELYNLKVGRGTLTPEDRFIINEHIIGTIKMLDSMPFPEEMANVPRYASTHHETLKGTGYPRKLSAEQLSIPERILVLADIFEALTASDRPYKKAKPLSVAIDILHKMCLDQHVDIEVFRLFLSSGVYLQYAQRFLPTSQIDEVDIKKYL